MNARPLPIVLLMMCVLGSCVVEINGNGYKSMTDTQKKHLKKFSIDSTDAVEDPKNNLALTEITGNDVKKVFNKYSYTWVLLWKPWCHGAHCYPLYYYERIDREHRNKNVKFLPVSLVYNKQQIKQHLEKSDFDRDIFVLNDGVYGNNIKSSKKKFLEDMSTNATLVKESPAHLVYKGDKLIYYGENMSSKIMDSVLSSN